MKFCRLGEFEKDSWQEFLDIRVNDQMYTFNLSFPSKLDRDKILELLKTPSNIEFDHVPFDIDIIYIKFI